jgi:hypothetical protein
LGKIIFGILERNVETQHGKRNSEDVRVELVFGFGLPILRKAQTFTSSFVSKIITDISP